MGLKEETPGAAAYRVGCPCGMLKGRLHVAVCLGELDAEAQVCGSITACYSCTRWNME